MTYRVAIGYDNSGGFSDITPQPSSPGIQGTRSFSLSRDVYDDFPYAVLSFVNVLTVAELVSILAQFNLTDNLTSEVTVSIPDHTRTFVTKNAKAMRPENASEATFERVSGWFNKVEIYLWIL
jgi:hypothetical protein